MPDLNDETKIRCVKALRDYLRYEHKNSRMYFDENGQIDGFLSLDAVVRVVLEAIPPEQREVERA